MRRSLACPQRHHLTWFLARSPTLIRMPCMPRLRLDPRTRTHSHLPSPNAPCNLYPTPTHSYSCPVPVPQPLLPLPLPRVRCVVLNAVAGILYSMSLIGLDPNMPDPTLK